MPDKYCSNLRNIANPNDLKFNNMKIHDCHAFTESLLRIAFSILPDDVLKPFIEISLYFKNLCSTTLREDVLKKMHRNIVITIYKLEMRFPLGFFNVREHLPMHLAKEEQLGDPIQYRRMYPFEM